MVVGEDSVSRGSIWTLERFKFPAYSWVLAKRTAGCWLVSRVCRVSVCQSVYLSAFGLAISRERVVRSTSFLARGRGRLNFLGISRDFADLRGNNGKTNDDRPVLSAMHRLRWYIAGRSSARGSTITISWVKMAIFNLYTPENIPQFANRK